MHANTALLQLLVAIETERKRPSRSINSHAKWLEEPCHQRIESSEAFVARKWYAPGSRVAVEASTYIRYTSTTAMQMLENEANICRGSFTECVG